MTAINLKKGQGINLAKVKNLKNLRVELTWNAPGIKKFDADVSALILGSNEKLLSDSHFVFYNNPESPNGALVSGGDVRASGDEDGENIAIELDKLDSNARHIDIIVSIHDEHDERHHFGQIDKGNLTLRDIDNDEVLAHFDFSKGEFDKNTIIHAARLSRNDKGWEAIAYGDGETVDLGQLLISYGATLEG